MFIKGNKISKVKRVMLLINNVGNSIEWGGDYL